MYRMFMDGRDQWALIVQIFPNDASVAIGHKDHKRLIQLIRGLVDVNHSILLVLDLVASLPFCNNFLVATTSGHIIRAQMNSTRRPKVRLRGKKDNVCIETLRDWSSAGKKQRKTDCHICGTTRYNRWLSLDIRRSSQRGQSQGCWTTCHL